MWLVRRILGAQPRPGLGHVRAYARWLDDALSRLAQALLRASPLVAARRSDARAALEDQQVRVRQTRQCLDVLRAEIDQHPPPPAVELASAAHADYVQILDGCLVAVDRLAAGLQREDTSAVAEASAALAALAADAADLHGRIIEWALPLL